MTGTSLPARLQALLLDRDGTINIERADYVRTPEQLVMLPGALDALARVAAWGIPVLVITNQSCVGRGIVSAQMLATIHEGLRDVVAAAGGRIDDFFVCPHHPEAGCDCRKPRPGLLFQAAERYGLDLSQCLFIGDSDTDMLAAEAAGCPALPVESGLRTSSRTPRIGGRSLSTLQSASDLATAVDILESVGVGNRKRIATTHVSMGVA